MCFSPLEVRMTRKIFLSALVIFFAGCYGEGITSPPIRPYTPRPATIIIKSLGVDSMVFARGDTSPRMQQAYVCSSVGRPKLFIEGEGVSVVFPDSLVVLDSYLTTDLCRPGDKGYRASKWIKPTRSGVWAVVALGTPEFRRTFTVRRVD